MVAELPDPNMLDPNILAKRLNTVIQETHELTKRFMDEGYQLYLVGGIVRDGLLGLPLQQRIDLDLTTDAQPLAVKSILHRCAQALWTQGERFGTIGAHLNNRKIEITTHRSERYVSGSRKPEVEFSDAIEVDLSRRDFTINAMAVELPSTRLVDPFGGVSDLQARLLRTPLEPGDTFSDDPIRMMRAARFLAQFQLNCDHSLIAAIKQTAERLSIVAHERIRDELDRLLALADPMPGFELLFATGLASRVLGPVADPPSVLKCLAQACNNPLVRLTVLMSGVGSPEQVRTALLERKATKNIRQTVPKLLAIAQTTITNPPKNQAELRHWVVDTKGKHALALAVVAALSSESGSTNNSFADDVTTLLANEADLLGPPVLDGAEIMAHLSLQPGPVVGQAVAELRRYRLEVGPLTADAARKHLTSWYANNL